jgi:hypothetical protein
MPHRVYRYRPSGSGDSSGRSGGPAKGIPLKCFDCRAVRQSLEHIELGGTCRVVMLTPGRNIVETRCSELVLEISILKFVVSLLVTTLPMDPCERKLQPNRWGFAAQRLPRWPG